MITTTGIQNFGLEFYDSTVTVLPGSARIGNTIRYFDGTQVPYNKLTNFGSEIGVYQNCLLYLQDLNYATDMTFALSDTTSEIRALDLPELPSDSTDLYSLYTPLSMLTFFTDGASISLEDNKEL